LSTAQQHACNYLSLEVAKQQAVHAIEQWFAGEVLDMVQAGPQRAEDVANDSAPSESTPPVTSQCSPWPPTAPPQTVST
jgi:PucR family transcriptional regulator, purine catabolism regulatory protein